VDLFKVENWIARITAIGVGLIGVAFLAVYPLTRTATARERADIDRAVTPLLSLPLEQLQTPTGRTFEVSIPNDDQWKRIAKWVGSPSFLIVLASAPSELSDYTYSPSRIGLSLRLRRNGNEVVSTGITTSESYTIRRYTTDGFKFVADPGDLVNIEARIGAPSVPLRAVLLVVPNWGGRVSGWAEGAGLAAVIRPFLALASVVVGIVFLWCAITIAWGRPTLTT
jgi:hypothetical protein